VAHQYFLGLQRLLHALHGIALLPRRSLLRRL
jgi:hypothetical protein